MEKALNVCKRCFIPTHNKSTTILTKNDERDMIILCDHCKTKYPMKRHIENIKIEVVKSDEIDDDDHIELDFATEENANKRKWEIVNYDDVKFLGSKESGYGSDQREIKKLKITYHEEGEIDSLTFSFPKQTTEGNWDNIFAFEPSESFIDDMIERTKWDLDKYEKWKNNMIDKKKETIEISTTKMPVPPPIENHRLTNEDRDMIMGCFYYKRLGTVKSAPFFKSHKELQNVLYKQCHYVTDLPKYFKCVSECEYMHTDIDTWRLLETIFKMLDDNDKSTDITIPIE